MTRPRVVALLLVLMTVAVYLPVWQCAFLTYDDPDYVTDNGMVRAGLTGAGLKWAFTTAHASNWHPLTWLSHMTDGEADARDVAVRAGVARLVAASKSVKSVTSQMSDVKFRSTTRNTELGTSSFAFREVAFLRAGRALVPRDFPRATRWTRRIART